MRSSSKLGMSKADMLQRLLQQLQLSIVDPLYVFTVAEWISNRSSVLAAIRRILSTGPLLVRSSAHAEDAAQRTLAGYFRSVSLPDDYTQAQLADAINAVISSYTKGGRSAGQTDQCFVQRQLRSVRCAGVVLTRTGPKAAPYYLIDYDASTGRTDTVTGGLPTRVLRVARWIATDCIEPPWRRLLESIKEIEKCVGGRQTLDVEFAVAQDGTVHVFQVRPVLTSKRRASDDAQVRAVAAELAHQCEYLEHPHALLIGAKTIFTDMSDWNPAEMLGGRCNPLDYSLYRFLVTQSAWNTARVSLGYSDVAPSELMLLLANKAYIDTRVSFNSLTPDSIPHRLKETLITHYLDVLSEHSELQDKVEFDIVFSCFDLRFEERISEVQEVRRLGWSDITMLRHILVSFTERLFAISRTLATSDSRSLALLEERRLKEQPALQRISPLREQLALGQSLLTACRDWGVVPFARFARLAFVGIALLRSLVKIGVLSDALLDDYMASLSTIPAQMRRDFASAGTPQELRTIISRYGHLRPGSYNICSPRLDTMSSVFESAPQQRFSSTSPTHPVLLPVAQIQRAFDDARLPLSAEKVLDSIGRTIEMRERAKFEFTKTLSDVIEVIARAAEVSGLHRREIALVDLDILCANYDDDRQWRMAVMSEIERQSKLQDIYSRVVLPACLSSARQLFIVPDLPARPNFVTGKVVIGKPLFVTPSDLSTPDLVAGAIVLIESADPGYDWLFTRQILGLITKYGGVASHMAIRCAEFGIPAAVGCGEIMFDRIVAAVRVCLDCARESIEII